MSDFVDWSANLKFTFSAISETNTKIQWFLGQKIGESPKQGISLPVSWDISPALSSIGLKQARGVFQDNKRGCKAAA